MRQPVATLILLACAAVTRAADITGKDFTVSIGGIMQLRAEHNEAIQEGDSYDAVTGALTPGGDAHYDTNTGAVGKADAVDFYARRLRLIVKATYQDVWRLNLTLNADRAEQPRGTAANTSTTAATRAAGVYQAFIARDFKDDTLIHTIQGGLDTAFFNRAGDFGPNTQIQFPSQRATGQLINPRGFGVGYRLTAPMVRFGVDVQNNLGDDGTDNALKNDGMLYTTRVELTGADEWAIPRWQEDFIGKPGHGWCLGMEVGYNHQDLTNGTATAAGLSEATYAHDFNGDGDGLDAFTVGTNANAITQSTLAYGIDLLVHYDGLSALAEVRFAHTNGEVIVGGNHLTGSYDSLIWVVQAGYGFAAPGDTVLEPGLRFSHIDLNTRNHNETAPYGANEFCPSGHQYEADLTWFLNGHANKLILAASWWQAEQGDADAAIIRIQHQFQF